MTHDNSHIASLAAYNVLLLYDTNAEPKLLDTYSDTYGAFSLRLLRTDYAGSCVRVRRSSDNAEQDIGFTAGVIDTASMESFCGAGDGFLAKWYDQGATSADWIQSTASRQPKIVSSGSTITLNGKPAAQLTLDTHSMGSSGLSETLTDFSLLSVFSYGGGGNSHRLLSHNDGGATDVTSPRVVPFIVNSHVTSSEKLGCYVNGAKTPATEIVTVDQQYIYQMYTANTPVKCGVNEDTLNTVVRSPTTDLTITNTLLGTYQAALSPFSPNCKIQEAIYFRSDHESDRDALLTDINGFYGAY